MTKEEVKILMDKYRLDKSAISLVDRDSDDYVKYWKSRSVEERF